MINILKKDIPESRKNFLDLCSGIVSETLPQVQLDKFTMFSEMFYYLEGNTSDFDFVTEFVVALKNIECVNGVKLEKTKEIDAKTLGFVIRVKLKG